VYACAPGESAPANLPMTTTTTTTTMMQGGGAPVTFTAPGGGAPPMQGPPGASQQRTMVNPNQPGAAPACLPAPVTVTGGITPPPPTQRMINVVDPSELPDYKPPMATGAVRADEDDNLWIRTIPTKPIPGGGVYDIVDRNGVLVNRLQMPPGYTIVGFGKGKVVYATMRDAQGIHLARVRLK
jgi:hypothetical protein